MKSEFTQAKVIVRAYDRTHSRELVKAGVDFEIRETFESAVRFGKAALCKIGVEQEEAEEIAQGVRSRDAERLQMEIASGPGAGRDLLLGNMSKPIPFTEPKRESKDLTKEPIATQS